MVGAINRFNSQGVKTARTSRLPHSRNVGEEVRHIGGDCRWVPKPSSEVLEAEQNLDGVADSVWDDVRLRHVH